MNPIDKYHRRIREEVEASEQLRVRVRQLEAANDKLLAELVDTKERLEVYKELNEAILFKSVDRYLQSVSTYRAPLKSVDN